MELRTLRPEDYHVGKFYSSSAHLLPPRSRISFRPPHPCDSLWLHSEQESKKMFHYWLSSLLCSPDYYNDVVDIGLTLGPRAPVEPIGPTRPLTPLRTQEGSITERKWNREEGKNNQYTSSYRLYIYVCICHILFYH